MRRFAPATSALFVALLIAPALVAAQTTAEGSASAAAAKTDPGTKKVLGLADIGRWKRIDNAALSADGVWMTYTYTPNEGDDTLFVRQLGGTRLYTIPVGSAPQFSDDSRFVGYFVSPPSEGRGGARGGRGGGRGGAPAAGPG